MSSKAPAQKPAMRGDLTQGPVLRTLLIFSVPMLLSNILQSLSGTVNSIWVTKGFGNILPERIGVAGSEPAGHFPGTASIGYVRFNSVPVYPTALPEPDDPGVLLYVPEGTVSIAAIQIRGQFIGFVPEPAGSASACLAVLVVRHARRRGSAKRPGL